MAPTTTTSAATEKVSPGKTRRQAGSGVHGAKPSEEAPGRDPRVDVGHPSSAPGTGAENSHPARTLPLPAPPNRACVCQSLPGGRGQTVGRPGTPGCRPQDSPIICTPNRTRASLDAGAGHQPGKRARTSRFPTRRPRPFRGPHCHLVATRGIAATGTPAPASAPSRRPRSDPRVGRGAHAPSLRGPEMSRGALCDARFLCLFIYVLWKDSWCKTVYGLRRTNPGLHVHLWGQDSCAVNCSRPPGPPGGGPGPLQSLPWERRDPAPILGGRRPPTRDRDTAARGTVTPARHRGIALHPSRD